ncbi:hypothetical protein cyc_03991 [Cyclospora cayetanensis]|uniref:Uncharacterized protein n=1 Tax=Cyclospora cayetanensis TaxID=88456 RepID=A0A1D3CRC7_9EIME|nr:hypothetical protein cyc_03991 [Cyclospora cayetanensis]
MDRETSHRHVAASACPSCVGCEPPLLLQLSEEIAAEWRSAGDEHSAHHGLLMQLQQQLLQVRTVGCFLQCVFIRSRQ